MATLTTSVWLYRYQPEYHDHPLLVVTGYESKSEDYVFLEKREISFEARDDDYIPERVQALRVKVQEKYLETSQEVAVIEERISKLLCIEGPANISVDTDIPF